MRIGEADNTPHDERDAQQDDVYDETPITIRRRLARQGRREARTPEDEANDTIGHATTGNRSKPRPHHDGKRSLENHGTERRRHTPIPTTNTYDKTIHCVPSRRTMTDDTNEYDEKTRRRTRRPTRRPTRRKKPRNARRTDERAVERNDPSKRNARRDTTARENELTKTAHRHTSRHGRDEKQNDTTRPATTARHDETRSR